MLKFYIENVKVYFRIAWYKYSVYLAMALPVFALTAVAVFLLRGKLPPHLFNLIALTVILTPVIVALLLGLAFLGKWLFITIYSLRVHRKESFEWGHILLRLYEKFTSPKILLALLLFPPFLFAVGYLLYTQVILNSVDSIKIGISFIILALLVLLLIKRKFLLHVLYTLWHLFTGILWKLLLIGIGILSFILVFVGIYLLVSLVISAL